MREYRFRKNQKSLKFPKPTKIAIKQRALVTWNDFALHIQSVKTLNAFKFEVRQFVQKLITPIPS